MEALSIGLKSAKEMWFGVLADSQKRLVASAFSGKHDPLRSHLAGLARELTHLDPKPSDSLPVDKMISLFNGREPNGDTLLNAELTTSFQDKVYKVLREIPKGRVTSYGSIAAVINSGARAVGTAVASNPWPLFVPCHRVVPSNLTIGNYSMNGSLTREGSEVKKDLLVKEGVHFEQNRIIAASFWKPSKD